MNCPKCKGSNIKVIGDSIYCQDCGLFNPQAEVRIECPYCGQPVETTKDDAARGIACPSCNKTFGPIKRESDPVHARRPAESSEPSLPNPWSAVSPAEMTARIAANRADRIRKHADRFTVVAGFSSLFGSVSAGVGLVEAIFVDGVVVGWFIAAGALIGVALWLYLIAQIIHIRANTEK